MSDSEICLRPELTAVVSNLIPMASMVVTFATYVSTLHLYGHLYTNMACIGVNCKGRIDRYILSYHRLCDANVDVASKVFSSMAGGFYVEV